MDSVSGFLDSIADAITFGGYSVVIGEIEDATGTGPHTDPDYYEGRVLGFEAVETASAMAAAAAAAGRNGGSFTCLATAGGGCVIAGTSTGVMVLAGFEGTYSSMMKDKYSDLYQYYKGKENGQEWRPLTLEDAKNVGFKPGKKFNGKKVTVPSGKYKGRKGWEDENGDIWVPARAGESHGGLQFDVQLKSTKFKKHRNVFVD